MTLCFKAQSYHAQFLFSSGFVKEFFSLMLVSFEKFFFDEFPFKTTKVIIDLQDLQSSQLLQFLH